MFIFINGVLTNINTISEIAKATTSRQNGDGTLVMVHHIVYKKSQEIEITEDFMDEAERDAKYEILLNKLYLSDSYMAEINSKLKRLLIGILEEDKSSPEEE